MPTVGANRAAPIPDGCRDELRDEFRDGLRDELRARIARLEADSVRDREAPARAPVPLGHPALDTALGGGLARGTLHEIRAREADGALAFGFAAALTARLAEDTTARIGGIRTDARWTLIVTTFDGAGEWGRLYGPGLAAFGLDPGRLLIVEARRPREALWAAEEGLSSRALATVLTEIRGDPALVDLTATRRLALRAAHSGSTAVLVRPGTGEGLSAARTRWRIGPLAQPDAPESLILPPPAWQADLERNAARPGGVFNLMWKPDEHVFAPLTPAPLVVTPDIANSGIASPGAVQPESNWPDTTLPRSPAAAPAGRTAPSEGSVERPSIFPLRRAG